MDALWANGVNQVARRPRGRGEVSQMEKRASPRVPTMLVPITILDDKSTRLMSSRLDFSAWLPMLCLSQAMWRRPPTTASGDLYLP
jgi:alpha-D-ribose 1-methylphosphonate 5-triphosphate synthase subunit PhnL